jgi:hypothetical protein
MCTLKREPEQRHAPLLTKSIHVVLDGDDVALHVTGGGLASRCHKQISDSKQTTSHTGFITTCDRASRASRHNIHPQY